MFKKNYASYKKIIYYLLIYLALSFVIIYFGFNKRYLIFNAGLSFIPYILTSFCANNKDRVLICTLFIIVSIVFYPNAIYMFTDLTHIKTSDFYSVVSGNVIYNMDYLVWIKLGAEVLIVLLSLMLSYESFINILKTFSCYGYKIVSFILLILSSVVTGIALYLGRFIRYNSWDIIKVKEILIHLLDEIGTNEYILIGVFAIIHFVLILLFANLKHN